jgi:hypothetical protein
MRFHGWLFIDNAFYEVYSDGIKTIEQAQSWLNSFSN